MVLFHHKIIKQVFSKGFYILLVIILISSLSYFAWFLLSPPLSHEGFKDVSLENGDLIFRRGRSAESFAVYIADKDRDYSHIGIIVIDNNKPFVVHATTGESEVKPEVIRKDPLEYFIHKKRASHIALYRPIINKKEKAKIAKQALKFYMEKRVFDDRYDLKSDDKLYCTELVLKAYKIINVDLSDIKPEVFDIRVGKVKIIFPSAFIRNTNFYKIFSN